MQRSVNGLNEPGKIEESQNANYLQFTVPQTNDKMNVPPQSQHGIRPPNAPNQVPFYSNASYPRSGVPQRPNAMTAYPQQPTMFFPQGTTVTQQPQVGAHSMYTVYINSSNQNSVPNQPQQYGANYSQPPQDARQQPYQNQQATAGYFQQYPMSNAAGNYPVAIAPIVHGGMPTNWAVPQQIMYGQQGMPGVYQQTQQSLMQQQPPPVQSASNAAQMQQAPRRERHVLSIIDPNTEKDVIQEELKNKESTSSSYKAAAAANLYSSYQPQPGSHQQPPPPPLPPAHHSFVQQQQTQLVHSQQSQSMANNSNLNVAAPENNQNISVSLSTSSSSHQMSTKSEDNSQNNSRGHTPSRSITPTADGANAGSNYSPGPPKQDQTTAEQEEASQKVYCEFALKIAKQSCAPMSTSTTPPPPPTKETTSEATEVTLHQQQTMTSTSLDAVAATENNRKPKDILNSENSDLGVKKESIDVSFGFFDSTAEASKDDSALADGVEVAAEEEAKTSTPVKNHSEASEGRKSVDICDLGVQDVESDRPRIVSTSPAPTATELPHTTTSTATKSAEIGEVSLEEGEIKENEEDEALAAAGRAKNDYEQQLALVASLRTAEMWSPENPQGRMCYSRDFMNALRELPLSKQRFEFSTANWTQDTFKDLTANRVAGTSSPREQKSRNIHMGSDVRSGGNVGFNPSWQPSGSMKKPIFTGRGSIGGGGGGGAGGNRNQGGRQSQSKNHQPQMIIPRPSQTQEVQLNKAENAWKPIFKQQPEKSTDPEKAKTEELYRRLKSILNKITPQTFDDLCDDCLAMEPEMNNAERTMGVITILFNKVCDEPNFCEMYGRLCDMLSQKQQKTFNREKNESFRYQLLTKCQSYFEQDKNSEKLKEEKLAEIENEQREDVKKKMKDDLDELLIKHKWRMLGSIKFVGELYKRNLLTKFIAQTCVHHLLSKNDDEESIECLCKFLGTIGQLLENDSTTSRYPHQSHNMGIYFERLQEIVDTQSVSKRIQFEIKNLMELRENKWVPRRKEAGPKKISEIHSEAKIEELNKRIDLDNQRQQQRPPPMQQQMQQSYRGGPQVTRTGSQRGGVPARGSYNEDDSERRRGGGSSRMGDSGREGGRDRGMRDKRQQPGLSSIAPVDNRQIEKGQLSKFLTTDSEIMLGPSRPFSSKNVTLPTSASSSSLSKTTNRFAQLTAADDERFRDSAPSSRDSSQNRSTVTNDQQAALNTAQLMFGTRGGPSPSATDTPSAVSREVSPLRSETAETQLDVNDEKFRHYATELLEEFVSSGVYEEAESLVKEREQHFESMLQIWLENVLEKTARDRSKLGELVAQLLSNSVVPLKSVADGFDKFVIMVIESGMEMDVPMMWKYLGEILGSILINRGHGGAVTVRLGDFHSTFRSAGSKSQDLLAHTLLTVQAGTSEKMFQDIWSSEQWTSYQFKDAATVESFLQKNNIKCLAPDIKGGVPSSVPNGAAVIYNNVPTSSIDPQLIELERHIKSLNPVDSEQLMQWITDNLNKETLASFEFVRALARSLCSKVLVGDEDDVSFESDTFESFTTVFQRFITGEQHLELVLLLELAQLYYDRGCPRDYLATMFDILANSQVIPSESFKDWHRREKESNTRGMILKNSQLNRFMERIK